MIRRRLCTSLVLPAALVLSAARLLAGVDRWTPLGPDGGAVTALAVAPGSSGQVWAATQSAGVFGSRDGGANWQPARSGLPSGEPILFLTAGGRDGHALYAATSASFYSTSDGGRNWARRALPAPLARNESFSVLALAASPSDAQTVYLSFNREPFGGLLKTVDGGRSWRTLNLGFGPLPPSPVEIAIAPSAPETLYLAFYGLPAGVLRSTDGGEHWSAAGPLPLDGFMKLAVDPREPRHVYATQAGFVTESADAGATWSPAVLVDESLRDENLLAAGLAIDPASPRTLVLALNHFVSNDGTWYGGGIIRYGGLVFRSLDGGASWSGPTVTDPIAGVQADGRHAGRIYAAVSRIGVLRSDDQGGTWRKSNRGLRAVSVCAVTPDPFSSGVLYLSASLCDPGYDLVASSDDPGFFKGMADSRADRDGAGAWTSINRGVRDPRRVLETYGVVPDPRTPGTLYALTAQGLFKSGNGGERWSSLQGGLGAILDAVLALAIDPDDPRTVYAAGYKLGYPICGGFCPLLPVYDAARSTDGGATWARLTLPISLGFDSPDPVFSFVIDLRDSRVVYLLSPTGKLLVSQDRGNFWTAYAVGPASPQGAVDSLQRLVIDPAAPQILYGTVHAPYGNPPRVVKSIDGGRTWELSFHGMPVRAGVHDLVLDPSRPATLYAATDRGVFVSVDGAESWSPLSAGLTSRNVLSVRVDPFDPATLYAATNGDGGLFVLTRSAR